MNDAITIITPRSLAEAKEMATTLAGARTIPEALQRSPADVLAIVMAGAELGLAPMQSIRALVLIKGKPTLSADAMGALVKSRRDICQYLLLKHSDAVRATYETQRVGDPAPTTMGFSIEEAKVAGLAGNDNWRKFTAAMLRARALSAICRAVYSDLILGVYDPDELAPERDVTPLLVVEAVVAAKPKRQLVVDAPASTPPPPVAAESDAPPPDPVAVEAMSLAAAIESAKTTAELTSLTMRLRALPEAERAALRPAYDTRLKAVGS